MKCNYCSGRCIKKGWHKQAQKYQCKICGKCQQATYIYQKYAVDIDTQIVSLNNEGVGVNSISRLLKIPRTTVLRRMMKAASRIVQPACIEQGQPYEIDELYTYVGSKDRPCYIIYVINRITRKIIDFVIGARTKENIKRLVDKLMLFFPKRIYTDNLNIFPLLIPASIHRTHQYKTNRIERKNLTIRTHLKRLSRKTICYSKSVAMLEASVRLYMFG